MTPKIHFDLVNEHGLINCLSATWRLTCHRVGGCGASGGAGRADHAGVAAADSTYSAGTGTAVAAPLPAFSGATGSLPGTVLSDVVTHLITSHKRTQKNVCTTLHSSS